MNFNIDIVSQDVISGWLTPDNPSVRAKFVIEVPDRNPIEFESNVHRPDILDLGWHTSGHVGFLVDQHLLPDIAELPEFALNDFHTGLTLYRRTAPGTFVDGKLMFFDCSLMPQWRLHRMIGEHFAVRYASLDRHALETSQAVLWNLRVNSVFASGAPNYLRYNGPLNERQYKTIALLRPPLEELAERMLFLKALSKMPANSSVRAMFPAFERMLDRFADVDLTHRKSITTLVRGLDGHDRDIMRSPITRTFGTEVTDSVDRRKVPSALDNLARLDFVGRRNDYPTFCAVLDGLIGRNILTDINVETALSSVPGTQDLAQRLRTIGPATDLIEEDLALYEFAEEAILDAEKPRG